MTHYYFQGGVKVIAILLGIVAGVVSRFFLSTPIALCIGAGAAIVSSLILALLFYLEDRPYRMLTAFLHTPTIVRERAMMQLQDAKALPACIYLYDGGMYLCSIQKEHPFCCRIPKKCISDIRLLDEIGHFRICFYDRLCYDLRCFDEDALMQGWKTQGFPIVDIAQD